EHARTDVRESEHFEQPLKAPIFAHRAVHDGKRHVRRALSELLCERGPERALRDAVTDGRERARHPLGRRSRYGRLARGATLDDGDIEPRLGHALASSTLRSSMPSFCANSKMRWSR